LCGGQSGVRVENSIGLLLPGVRIGKLLQLLRDLLKIIQVLLSSRGALVVLLGLHLPLIQALDLVLSGTSLIDHCWLIGVVVLLVDREINEFKYSAAGRNYILFLIYSAIRVVLLIVCAVKGRIYSRGVDFGNTPYQKASVTNSGNHLL
jgi:hypothetical protein